MIIGAEKQFVYCSENAPHVDCKTCGGNGLIECDANGDGPCSECGGYGKVDCGPSDRLREDWCDACEGTGLMQGDWAEWDGSKWQMR